MLIPEVSVSKELKGRKKPWERRLSVAQHRYLLACQTLAKIRRLGSKYPNLQVNIATQNGKQVNVAGDLRK